MSQYAKLSVWILDEFYGASEVLTYKQIKPVTDIIMITSFPPCEQFYYLWPKWALKYSCNIISAASDFLRALGHYKIQNFGMDFATKGAAGILSGVMDKVSFANFLPLLTRATAENDEPTPGYMLQEIEKISYENPHCQQLVEYLNKRLEKPSAASKLKVLRIMMHLIQNGDVHFRQYLRGNDSCIKLAAMYSGLPDPHLGMTPYENVRKRSQELLELLFNAECIQQDEQQQQTAKNKPLMGGLGSAKSGSKYEGFGNTPLDKDESIRSRMLNMLERLINPTEETAETVRTAFSNSPGNYRPVCVPQFSVIHQTEPSIKLRNRMSKVHVPGRAGGGWDSESEHDNDREGSNVSEDSLERAIPTEDESIVENTIVTNFCTCHEWPVSPSDLMTACKRFAAFNCVDVMQAMAALLLSPDCTTITALRTLLVLEWFLRTDLVTVATTTRLMALPLDRVMELHHLGAPVMTKAKKVQLILEKLGAH